MRIVIDLQAAQAQNRLRGIGRFSLSFCKALVQQRGSHEIILLLSGLFPESIESIRREFSDTLVADQIVVWYAPRPLESCNSDTNWWRAAAEQIRHACICNLKPAFVLLMSWFEGFGDDALITLPQDLKLYPVGSILYDLIPLVRPKEYLDHNPSFKRYYLDKVNQLSQMDLLLAISQSSRNEAISQAGILPDIIENISAAAEDFFVPIVVDTKVKDDLFNRLGISNPFVMYTGGIDKRKNIEGLIRSFALLLKPLRHQYQLVIVCDIREDDHLHLRLLAKTMGLSREELVLTGYVSETDLLLLYNLCHLFVFPSLHEGFGLPVLEAMACGCAVICSDSSSLPEVMNYPAALFDPCNESAICQKLTEVLSDPKIRSELKVHALIQAKKFSWQATASQAYKAIERCTERVKLQAATSLVPAKPRLAFISPLPPERSGISDYSAELLPELATYYEIDVIIAQDEIADSWVNTHCTVGNIKYFLERADQYARVLYHFGNSTFHGHMFALLKQVPGVVVLHDFYLSGIVAHREVHQNIFNAWSHELYHSHGYHAVQERYAAHDTADTVFKYPCNLSILEAAVGTIVHSNYARSLFTKWYGKSSVNNCFVIPLLRIPFAFQDRHTLRANLQLTDEDFVVCSFGVLGKSKLNHRLISAWLSSSLARDLHCILIFVGDYSSLEYEQLIKKAITQGICANRIRVTGWVSTQTYREYLGAADLAVQLRDNSRGETSAAVLDCFNARLPTIVNCHGSLADLPADTCYQLSEKFTDVQLARALEMLWIDQSVRQVLAVNAKTYLEVDHVPSKCALQYRNAIEKMYEPNATQVTQLIERIAQNVPSKLGIESIDQIANSVAKTMLQPYHTKQILVDISELVQRDSRSGIQRVVRSILKEWLENPPAGYRIEPVYATLNHGYRYARQYTLGFLDCPQNVLQDDWIEFYPGDHFIGLDLQPQVVISKEVFYKTLRQAGVKVQFVVYDLLPVLMPQYFVEAAKPLYESWLSVVAQSHEVLCISNSVSEQFKYWQLFQPSLPPYQAKSSWFHLGADVGASVPTSGIPKDGLGLLKDFDSRTNFLMVGTLEPRKGHHQVLDAFDELWKRGEQVNLIIVGKQGWMVNELLEKMTRHPQFNQKLFWLAAISDEYLELLYNKCQCLIVASEGEGFGLPLIEAAMHGLPIIARDIPVFREVAGEHAFYFSGGPTQIAGAIKEWFSLFVNKTHPKSDQISWKTWKQSAHSLLGLVLEP